MIENVILRCLQCNELFCPTRYDNYPSYDFDKKTGALKEIKRNDLRDFKISHKGHRIEELQVINGSFYSNYAYWEPVREDYIQVTNGSKVYTVRRWRKYINEPLKYQIVNFDVVFGKPILEVQSTDLEKQMRADAAKFGFTKAKIKKFTKRFKAFVSRLELDDLLECGFSVDEPMVSYAKLKDEVREIFLDRCRSGFSESELEKIRIFINENSEYNDVMNVQVIRPFYLKPVSKRFHLSPSSISLNSL